MGKHEYAPAEKPADFMWIMESRLEQATKKLGYMEQRYDAVKQEVQAEWTSMKTHLQKKPADFMWVVESRLEQATEKLGYMESRLMEFDFSGVEVGRQVMHAISEFEFAAGRSGIFWWKRKLVEIQAAWARGAKKRI